MQGTTTRIPLQPLSLALPTTFDVAAVATVAAAAISVLHLAGLRLGAGMAV